MWCVMYRNKEIWWCVRKYLLYLPLGVTTRKALLPAGLEGEESSTFTGLSLVPELLKSNGIDGWALSSKAISTIQNRFFIFKKKHNLATWSFEISPRVFCDSYQKTIGSFWPRVDYVSAGRQLADRQVFGTITGSRAFGSASTRDFGCYGETA